VSTHDVTNQPPPLVGYNLFDADLPLRESLEREGGSWAHDMVRELGRLAGTEEAIDWGFQANANSPKLRTHDRFGNRIDTRLLATTSLVIFAIVAWMRSGFTSEVDIMTLVWPTVLQGAAVSCFFIPLIALSLAGLRHDQIATAGELVPSGVLPDLDSRTGFRHREWQKCWRLIKPGRKCGAKL